MSLWSWTLKPAAYLSLPVLTLHHLSGRSPIARYYIRLLLFLASVGALSAWGVLVSIALSLAGQRFSINYVIARSFYAVAGRALGIRLQLEGEEHLTSASPAVLLGNHQSMLDILFLGRVMPRRSSIMVKKELKYMPLLGQFLYASGAVFINRGNNQDAVKALAVAGQTMKEQRTSLWFFPEGTRTNSEKPNLLPFKKGAFHLAVQAGIPVIPLVCENYWRLYHEGTFESGTLRVRVLPPISTLGMTAADVPELANRTRDAMLKALQEMSQPFATGQDLKSTQVPGSSPAVTPDTSQPLIDVREMKQEAEEKLPLRRQDQSPPRVPESSYSETGSVSGVSEQTEEDDGMVLVGRPAT